MQSIHPSQLLPRFFSGSGLKGLDLELLGSNLGLFQSQTEIQHPFSLPPNLPLCTFPTHLPQTARGKEFLQHGCRAASTRTAPGHLQNPQKNKKRRAEKSNGSPTPSPSPSPSGEEEDARRKGKRKHLGGGGGKACPPKVAALRELPLLLTLQKEHWRQTHPSRLVPRAPYRHSDKRRS